MMNSPSGNSFMERVATEKGQPDEFMVMKEPNSTAPVHVKLNTTKNGSQSSGNIRLKSAIKGLEVHNEPFIDGRNTLESSPIVRNSKNV